MKNQHSSCQESEPDQAEILDALSDVGTEYLTNGAKTLEAFTEKLVSEFGEEFRDHAETILGMSKDKLAKLAVSVRQKTPQELAALIDPTLDINEKMVYNMALGFLRQGIEGVTDVLNAVTDLLRNDYPDITFDEVVVAFTNYGRIKNPSLMIPYKDSLEFKEKERVIERLNAKIADLTKAMFSRETDVVKDPG